MTDQMTDQERVRNATTEQQERRLLTTLERLLSIPFGDVQASLNAATTVISDAMKTEKVDIFLYESESDSLVARGTSNTEMGRKQHRIGLDRLPISNGGRYVEVFQTGKPFLSGNVGNDPDELRGIKIGLGVRATLAAPIEVGGVRQGLLSMVSDQADVYSDADLLFCQAVARWIGLVIHRAELAEQIKQETAAHARQVVADELILLLAHDLRAPLTPARGYLDLIRRGAEREGRARDLGYIKQIMTALDRLSAMISDILDASRLEQGLFDLDAEPFDLSLLVRQTVDAVRTPTARVALQAPDEGPVLQGDPSRIRQALENLISNAIEHGPEGVPVTVTVSTEHREDGDWAIVAVRDEGPGIAPSLLATLFTRFARRDKSTGLGLGLYLAHGIVEAHGGALTVELQVGAGTTFRLALPMRGIPRQE